MEVGLALPQYDYSHPGAHLEWATVVDWAVRAERLGLGSVWLADHLFLSIEKYGGPPEEYFGYDPIIGLAALARATTRIRLGTLVLCAQLRPATLLAKNLASLDVLAGGRLTVGIGAGWYEPEYRAAGVAFGAPAERLRQLEEVVGTLRTMLEATSPVPCRPPPLQQPRPPVWVGGKGNRLLDLVARHADGWNTVWTWTPEAYRERLDVLDRACERAGRDPATVTRSLGLFTLVGENEADLRRRFERLRHSTPPGVLGTTSLAEWKTGRLVGSVEEVREQVAHWEQLGVATVVAGLGAVPFSVTHPDDLDMLASALI